MTKLKIRITQSDSEAKQGRWFIDKELLETTVFLHEFDEEDFFEILEAIGKIVNSGRDVKVNSGRGFKKTSLSEEEIRRIQNTSIKNRLEKANPPEKSD